MNLQEVFLINLSVLVLLFNTLYLAGDKKTKRLSWLILWYLYLKLKIIEAYDRVVTRLEFVNWFSLTNVYLFLSSFLAIKYLLVVVLNLKCCG